MKYVRIQQLFSPIVAGVLQVGQLITNYGPDLLTSCGNPGNILSVGTTYVVGIGGPCSAYGEWTQYSRYPTEHRQALSNGCSNSSTVTLTSTIVASSTVTPTSTIVTSSTVTPTSTIVTSSTVTPTSTIVTSSTVTPTSTIVTSSTVTPTSTIVTSSTVTPTSTIVTSSTVTPTSTIVTSSTVTPTSATTISVRPTPTSGIDDNSSGARGIVFPVDLMVPMAAIMFVVFFVNT